MAKTPKKVDVDTASFTADELALIQKFRESKANPDGGDRQSAQAELVNSLVEAINITRPKEKKTPFNRPKIGAFDPKDGRKKPKMKRAFMQHGVDMLETTLTAEEIELLNQIRPGRYCSGFVKVIKRKDGAYDIDYPMKTVSQRLKLTNQYGIRNLTELLQRCISERANPTIYRQPDEDDDE